MNFLGKNTTTFNFSITLLGHWISIYSKKMPNKSVTIKITRGSFNGMNDTYPPSLQSEILKLKYEYICDEN